MCLPLRRLAPVHSSAQESKGPWNCHILALCKLEKTCVQALIPVQLLKIKKRHQHRVQTHQASSGPRCHLEAGLGRRWTLLQRQIAEGQNTVAVILHS